MKHNEHPHVYYTLAPRDWNYSDPLPDTGQPFTREWSGLVFLKAEGENYFNGTLPNGLYTARYSRRTPHLSDRVADFLRYEHSWKRSVLVSTEYAFDVDAFIAAALEHTPPACELRSYDAQVWVHSTPLDRWRSIQTDGEILSAAELTRRGKPVPAVGFAAFGEPDEYTEFVHFSSLGVATGEVIVLSHATGSVTTEFDAEYVPGARVYLNAYRMIRDGRIARDGLHMAKVLRSVYLSRYAIDAITADDLTCAADHWTPREFAEAADREYTRRHPQAEAWPEE